MTIDKIFDLGPYALTHTVKQQILDNRLKALTRHHYYNCSPYRHMMDAWGIDLDNLPDYENLPFLPVRLFKELELRSCAKENVAKTLTSSGTTGQAVSRIYLDKDAAARQTRCLTHIMQHFLGHQRVPMIIIDSPSVVKNRAMFSARGAGILGFSIFGSKRIYALDEEMKLNVKGLLSFIDEHNDKRIFLFGFTFMIWQHFFRELKKAGIKLDLSHGVMIHGGGWKKLLSEKVSSSEFKSSLNEVCGISPTNIHDYYGMVEQTGTICVECEKGHLHASTFSDVIIRDPKDFSVCPVGKQGLIEVASILPESYPGHLLLTEDLGTLLGEDDCECGRYGKYFKIEGRIKNAELRGCSDTYASKF